MSSSVFAPTERDVALVEMLDRPLTYRTDSLKKPRVTWEKLRSIIDKRRIGTQDVMLEARRVDFVPSLASGKVGKGNMIFLEGQYWILTQLAWRQLCGTYRIPVEYANRVDAEERKRLLGYWFDHDPKRILMFRTKTVKRTGAALRVVRAVVPPSNSRFDHHIMLDQLVNVLRRGEVIQHFTLDDLGMFLSAGCLDAYDTCADPAGDVSAITKLTKKDDPIIFGMQMANSEVDAYPFDLSLSMLRIASTGCLVGWDPKSVYKRQKKFGDILGFREVCSEALREMAAERVFAVRFMREARAARFDPGLREHEKLVAKVFRTYKLSGPGLMDDVLLSWQRNPSGNPPARVDSDAYTKFGLVDALMRAALTLSDRIEQHKWEVAAGRLLSANV